MNLKRLAVVACLAVLALPLAARADWYVGFGGPFYRSYYRPRLVVGLGPVVVAPRVYAPPVYVQPAPVYVQPAPVYQPYPVYVSPPAGYSPSYLVPAPTPYVPGR